MPAGYSKKAPAFCEAHSPRATPLRAPPTAEAAAESAAAAGCFSSNEEAAAACSLHSIPAGVLNCGYYARFFAEERKLGAGSFGAVYLCRHVMDGIDLGIFAVKKLALGDDTKRLRQVVREVKALERLRHMNIVDYKHSWLEVSRHSEFCPYVPFLFILMEYCNAGSMESLIWPAGFVRGATGNAEKAAFLSEDLIWRLFLDVCCGLAHLHSRGILHRDLKPSNILLHIDEVVGEHASREAAPRAMLSDFGTCEIHGEGRSSDGGGYAVEFAAPERLRGEESEEPADVWSAGLVLYALCAGDLPYHSEDPEACREQVLGHTVLSSLPSFRDPCLCGLISSLTAKEPVARPTAEEAERACAAAVSRLPEGAAASRGPGPLPDSAPGPAARRSAGRAPLELMDEALLQLQDGNVASPKEGLSSAFPSMTSVASAAGLEEANG
ncbi:unnamed protein product [Prorocentrum cordatum]|uniref:Protein kinase domain-containing protein n=1 Tax=Prorocentrum cordatum TaxID=2364126 RepID=A0ABN9XEU5_9DINO|nr:unnamed protein product [Polarella glacialis]